MSKLLYVHFITNFDVKSLIFSFMFNNYNDFSFEIRNINTESTDFVIVIYIYIKHTIQVLIWKIIVKNGNFNYKYNL